MISKNTWQLFSGLFQCSYLVHVFKTDGHLISIAFPDRALLHNLQLIADHASESVLPKLKLRIKNEFGSPRLVRYCSSCCPSLEALDQVKEITLKCIIPYAISIQTYHQQ